MNRQSLADLILDRIGQEKTVIKNQYEATKHQIGYFFIDNLLPIDIAK